jgi:predicted  nucleic acid-binding Zn-ribbon protein
MQEIDKETRRKTKLEKELRQCQGDLQAKCEEVEARQNKLQQSEEEIKKCEQQLRETRVSLPTQLKDWVHTHCIWCMHTVDA